IDQKAFEGGEDFLGPARYGLKLGLAMFGEPAAQTAIDSAAALVAAHHRPLRIRLCTDQRSLNSTGSAGRGDCLVGLVDQRLCPRFREPARVYQGVDLVDRRLELVGSRADVAGIQAR